MNLGVVHRGRRPSALVGALRAPPQIDPETVARSRPVRRGGRRRKSKGVIPPPRTQPPSVCYPRAPGCLSAPLCAFLAACQRPGRPTPQPLASGPPTGQETASDLRICVGCASVRTFCPSPPRRHRKRPARHLHTSPAPATVGATRNGNGPQRSATGASLRSLYPTPPAPVG